MESGWGPPGEGESGVEGEDGGGFGGGVQERGRRACVQQAAVLTQVLQKRQSPSLQVSQAQNWVGVKVEQLEQKGPDCRRVAGLEVVVLADCWDEG